MTPPRDLIDRRPEWAELSDTWVSDRPELVFVLGRRRVGKSFLLTRFARRTRGLYYQATRRTEAEQLNRLSTLIGEKFRDPALRRGVPFPDWEALFGYLVERAAGQPFTVVLDEFPYLADAAPVLPSVLQALWDHEWADTRIRLVLCGSHVSAMRRLEESDQPLYGRRTRRLLIQPFACPDIAPFLGDAEPREILRTYAVFGGLPGHLALLDLTRDLGGNAARQVLDPAGRLVDEAQHMLDAFLGDAAVHYSILEAIAAGERTWGGMRNRVGREGGSFQRALEWLLEMGFVERAVPITESGRGRSQRAIYRIVDPYVGFWHRFVWPLLSRGAVGMVAGERLWEDEIEPRLDEYLGEVFERVCRDFVRRGHRRLPFTPTRVGAWWDRESRNEIDVVAVDQEGRVLAGECKWGAVDRNDIDRLRTRVDRMVQEMSGVREVHLALFSGRPGDRESDAGIEVVRFGPADLVG